MRSGIRTICLIGSTVDIHGFHIPIESIRKTRSLNLDRTSLRVSREVYKIFKSENGRKIFS
jgi:hypothetical protein